MRQRYKVLCGFCRDERIESSRKYPVRTLAGDMTVEISSDDPFRAKINMGETDFRAAGGKDGYE